MSTIGTQAPRIGTTYTGGAGRAGGAGATNNAAGYYGQGASTTGQVANGFSNFVQGGNDLLGFQGGGGEGGGTINPMPKFNSPILAKSQQNANATPETNTGSKEKRLASIFDEDEGGGDGGE
jgi:hypothetical protein